MPADSWVEIHTASGDIQNITTIGNLDNETRSYYEKLISNKRGEAAVKTVLFETAKLEGSSEVYLIRGCKHRAIIQSQLDKLGVPATSKFTVQQEKYPAYETL